VYVSHIKKIIAWYNALQRKDLLGLLQEKEANEDSGDDEKQNNHNEK
jgi:hypothetical protein